MRQSEAYFADKVTKCIYYCSRYTGFNFYHSPNVWNAAMATNKKYKNLIWHAHTTRRLAAILWGCINHQPFKNMISYNTDTRSGSRTGSRTCCRCLLAVFRVPRAPPNTKNLPVREVDDAVGEVTDSPPDISVICSTLSSWAKLLLDMFDRTLPAVRLEWVSTPSMWDKLAVEPLRMSLSASRSFEPEPHIPGHKNENLSKAGTPIKSVLLFGHVWIHFMINFFCHHWINEVPWTLPPNSRPLGQTDYWTSEPETVLRIKLIKIHKHSRHHGAIAITENQRHYVSNNCCGAEHNEDKSMKTRLSYYKSHLVQVMKQYQLSDSSVHSLTSTSVFHQIPANLDVYVKPYWIVHV